MTDVMISYSRKDIEFARRLQTALTTDKRDVWIDWEDIPKTADWWNEIKDGIEKADNFLYIISPDSVNSEVCSREIDHAINLKKRLIPVLYREIIDAETKAKMSPALNAHNWVFARSTDDFDTAYKQIVSAMDTDLDYVRTHTRLLTRALEWDRANRDKSFLLTGSDLETASNWLTGSTGKKPAPDNFHQQYIGESQRVAGARRRNLIAATLFTVIVATLAGIAVWQAVRAENARRVAVAAEREAQSLALSSNALVVYENDNLDGAIALALQALEQDGDSPEAERALSTAAYAPGTRIYLDLGFDITAAAMSPDAQTILAGGEDGIIHHVSAADTSQHQSLTAHSQPVTALSYNGDGTLLLSSSLDGTLRLWDTASNEVTQTIETDQPITYSALSPDGEYAASISQGALLLWRLDTGESQPVSGHEADVASVAFSADSSQLVSSDLGGVMQVWSIAEAQSVSRIDTSEADLEEGVTCVVFSPDGTLIYFCGTERNGTIRNVYEWRIGDEMFRRPGRLTTVHAETMLSIAVSPNGRQLVTGSADNHAILWNSGTLLPENALHGQGAPVIKVDYDNTGRWILEASTDGTLRLWDIQHGALIHNLQTDDTAIWDIVFSPDGQHVIANNSLDLIDIETGETERSFESADTVYALSFNPSGDLLAAGLLNGEIVLWDTATGDEVQRLEGHTDAVWTLLFTDDGSRLLSVSDDQTARVWDTASWEVTRQYDHASGIWAAALSPDNNLFATGTVEGEITFWNFDSTTPVRVIDRGTDNRQMEVLDLDFSPDGAYLVSGESDNHVRVWEVATGALAADLAGHHGKVGGVAYSRDGRYIISAGYDNQVFVWQNDTFALARTFIGHNSAVTDVTISPDGKTLVSGTLTGNLRLWNVHNREELIAWARANRYVPASNCPHAHSGSATQALCD